MSFVEMFPFIGLQVILLSVAINTLLLKRKGIRVTNKSKRRSKLMFLLHPLFLVLFHLIMFEISTTIFHISVLPESLTNPFVTSTFLQIFGAFIILVSLLLHVFTLFHFGQSFRFGMDAKNRGRLVTNGIFRFSRNPFFLSLIFYFWGITMVISSPFFITITVVATVSIHLFILKEEKFMKQYYGVEYEVYCKKVRRYF